jgi:hypothetical protein
MWLAADQDDANDPKQQSRPQHHADATAIFTQGSKMLSRSSGPRGSSFYLAADFTSSSERTTLTWAPAYRS